MGEKRNTYKILAGKPEVRDHWEYQDVDGWTILNLILERYFGVEWIGLVWLRIGPVEGSCKHGNKPPGSIKFWEFLEWLHNWQVLKKGSALSVSE
jgi:hypothetical protein